MERQHIRLTFSDGEAMHFPPVDGETILVSAEKAGNLLASNCREGTCRTCAARDENGDEVLLCVTPASPGISLALPYRRTDVAPPTLRRAKINAFSRVSRSVWEIRYRLQFPLPFLPGPLSSIDPASAPPALAVVAGFADAEDAYALEALRALAQKLPLEVVLVADRAGEGWPGVTANPVAALREVATVPLARGTEAYLCGPPGMVAAARRELLAAGLDAADVLNEEFVHG